jgi:hypothetical protein
MRVLSVVTGIDCRCDNDLLLSPNTARELVCSDIVALGLRGWQGQLYTRGPVASISLLEDFSEDIERREGHVTESETALTWLIGFTGFLELAVGLDGSIVPLVFPTYCHHCPAAKQYSRASYGCTTRMIISRTPAQPQLGLV